MTTTSATWAAAIVSALTLCATAAAQPPLEFGPELAPTQPPVAARAAVPPAGELGDVVVQASGGLVLMVPPGWHVAEVPWVREERLVLTPAAFAGARRMPHDGVWITYHYRPEVAEEPALAEIVGPRLALATSSRAVPQGAAVPEEIDGWPATRQPFHLPATTGSATAAEPSLGQHILIRTGWGIVEIHACYPESLAADRETVLQPMVARLKLAAPRPAAGPIDPSVADASEALGAWKAYAARMEFGRDGRVTMFFDNRRLHALDERPTTRVSITGSFTAEGDLIHVTWDDGSQQNFRWRRAALDLVLTDHTGQVSALRKVFQ